MTGLGDSLAVRLGVCFRFVFGVGLTGIRPLMLSALDFDGNFPEGLVG